MPNLASLPKTPAQKCPYILRHTQDGKVLDLRSVYPPTTVGGKDEASAHNSHLPNFCTTVYSTSYGCQYGDSQLLATPYVVTQWNMSLLESAPR